MYKPNFEELDKLVESGHLRKVISPCGKLFLYNYTDHCTFDRLWNKHTLNSRGTVYEVGTGKVIARAFPKFFNYSELTPEKQKEYIGKKFTAFEKADGSLGIIYYYDGSWRVNTRGSFTSDQAIKATEMLDKYNVDVFNSNTTYLVEIIYPLNRIIVDYGKEEKLVLLGAIKGGVDLCRGWLEIDSKLSKMSICEQHNIETIEDLQELQKTMDHTEEGFVALFENGDRVKFKSLEYLNVARLTNHMTPLSFWKALKDGKVEVDFLEHLPEEFRKEAEELKLQVEYSYESCRAEILADFAGVMTTLDIPYNKYTDSETRKELGLYLKNNKVRHSGAMFQMLLGNNLEPYILKIIRPKNNILDK